VKVLANAWSVQALARRTGFNIGDHVYLGGSEPRVLLQSSLPQFLVTGLLATGGAEDDAIILPLGRGSASFRAARPISQNCM